MGFFKRIPISTDACTLNEASDICQLGCFYCGFVVIGINNLDGQIEICITPTCIDTLSGQE